MTHSERIAFLKARSMGLGGSDCGALLQPFISEVKYGCRRKLFLEKSKIEPDFDREETGPMRLGNLLEPVLCEEFAKLTGRKIEVVGQQKHPDHPELLGHVDRMQYIAGRTPGVLECKALGTRIYYETKRTGIAIEYLLQINFYFVITGSDWGSFIVGNRDNLAILHWDVERNESICEAIIREGVDFWSTVGHMEFMPDALEPDDRRCQRCEYRLRCHGAALMPSNEEKDIPVAPELTALAVEYIERDALYHQANDLREETKAIIMAEMGERTAVQVPVNGELRPLYWRPQEGKPLYAEAVKAMSTQYNVMREKLIEVMASGAELIPPPSSFIKKGKPSRPLMVQYLEAKKKEGK